MPGLIKLTISITAAGAVDIDCAGKKGGHVRGMALRRVRWLKDCVCRPLRSQVRAARGRGRAVVPGSRLAFHRSTPAARHGNDR